MTLEDLHNKYDGTCLLMTVSSLMLQADIKKSEAFIASELFDIQMSFNERYNSTGFIASNVQYVHLMQIVEIRLNCNYVDDVKSTRYYFTEFTHDVASILVDKESKEQSIDFYHKKYTDTLANLKENYAKEFDMLNSDAVSIFEQYITTVASVCRDIKTIKNSIESNRLYKYIGEGVALGSVVIVQANSRELAETLITEEMNAITAQVINTNEIVDVTPNAKCYLVHIDNGDY